MKNLRNNLKPALTIICCLGLTLLINSCKGDDIPTNCGCDSETITTILESANLVGEMYYKTQSNDPMDTYYNNQFWIVYTEENCVNCVHSLIVCNEEIMTNQFENIKQTGEVVDVKFSGLLKEICEKTFAPADYTYERITLTSIERK
ncbi:hypothetical protein [Leeuwenhoekiella marinoflava]|uniref:hypothetical protein n=1 Tax=Leeuwenhoekiella marinoflava TaxID=988 RepID=UPI003001C82C